LANHKWSEPLDNIIENNKKENLNIITPMIGQKVDLNNPNQKFEHWWENLK
jgi:hypothetical protein